MARHTAPGATTLRGVVISSVGAGRITKWAFFIGIRFVWFCASLRSVWARRVPPIPFGQASGPDASPAVPNGKLPEKLSKTENVEWAAEIPGRGWSSPIVIGQRVFLTTATTEGKSKSGAGKGIFAIKPGGTGNLTAGQDGKQTEYVAWSQPRGGTYLPTEVAYDGALYVLSEKGILSRYEAKTGADL